MSNSESQPSPRATAQVRRRKANRRRRDRGETVNDGWVKLYRSLVDHPRFQDGDWLKVWVFLLCRATHAAIRRIFAGADTVLSPGQLITSRKSIVDFCDVEPSKVERILKTLETEQQIEQRSCSTCRLVTIVNWDKYQRSEQPNDQRVNNERPAGEQRVTTHKNGKKEKNDEEGKSISADAEAIYDLYPRKVGRPAALKAIRRALTRISAADLKSKTESYAKVSVGADLQFIPYPATWFNQDRFNDSPEEWRRRSQANGGPAFPPPFGDRRSATRRPTRSTPNYDAAA